MALFSRSTSTSTATRPAEPAVSPGPAASAGPTVLDAAPQGAIEDLTGDYQLDSAHTRLGFSARHAMVTTVRGSFREFEGHAHLDAADPSRSSAELRIRTASIDTGQEQRDAHLASPDFFAVEEHPEMVFRSTAVEQLDGETFRLAGDLSVKGVTRPVSVDFTFTGTAKDPFGNLRAGFEGSTTIKRSDWGLTWNAALETGGVLVSDKVKLDFDVSAIKLTPTA